MELHNIKLPSNRKFGLFFTAVFALIGTYLILRESATLSYISFTLSFLFLTITLVNANLLLPLNRLWMKLGLFLGMLIRPIVLGVIFFGLFTPISLLMKFFGRDELLLKTKDRESYWKVRYTDATQSEAFKRQF
jgi:polyferredoxin